MNNEANRLIAEAISGFKAERCCNRYGIENLHFSCKDLRENAHQIAGMDCCEKNREPEACPFSYISYPPDYCGNDNDALDAIKALQNKGWDVKIHLPAFPLLGAQILLLGSHKGSSEDLDNPLAAAFGSAMVEHESYCKETDKPCDMRRIERVAGELCYMYSTACHTCHAYKTGYRIRPAIEAALKKEK